jgi:hypothetical protein
MRTIFLFSLVSLAVFSSCTSMYKSTQTPDDVYFSPPRGIVQKEEYVNVQEENRYQTFDQYSDAYRNDRFLRMGVRNRYQINSLEALDWYNMRYNNLYSYGYYDSWNNPWNNYYSWNNYYNPYCCHTCNGNYYSKGSSSFYARPAPIRSYTFNRNSYKSSNRPATSNGSFNNNNRYNNSNSNNLGSSFNKLFGSGGSNNRTSKPATNTSTPTRAYTPSTNDNSSGNNSTNSNTGGNNSGSNVKRPGGGQ